MSLWGLSSPSCLWYSLKRKLPRREDDEARWSGVERGEKIPHLLASNRIGRFIEGAASKRIDEEIVKPKGRETERRKGDRGNILWRYFDVGYGMLVNIVPCQCLRRGFCCLLLSYHLRGKDHKGTQTSWGALSTIWCVACSSLKERFVRIIVVICFGLWRLGSGAETRTTKLAPLSLSLPLLFIRQIRR